MNHYEYDVFVSYSLADAGWVHDELLPRLQAAGLRVGLRHHDQADHPLSDEILVDEVRQSSFTIAVLTPDWIMDEWPALESIVRQQPALVQPGPPRIVPLMIEPSHIPARFDQLDVLDFTRPANRNWSALFETLQTSSAPRRSLQVSPLLVAAVTFILGLCLLFWIPRLLQSSDQSAVVLTPSLPLESATAPAVEADMDDFTTPTETTIRATATAVPTQTALLRNVQFCNGDTDAWNETTAVCETAQSTLQYGIGRLGVSWEYRNVNEGAVVGRVWYLDGEEYHRRESTWTEDTWETDPTQAGTFLRNVEQPGAPLPAGTYRLDLYLDDMLVTSGTVTIMR